MSPDVIGMIVALFAFVVTVLGGVGGMLSHQSKTLKERFDRIDERFDRMDGRFDRMDGDMVEIKVAIARLEGPLPKLQHL